MTALYVFWQQPETKRWYPVAQLSRENGKYQFTYTYGATQAKGFEPFGRMTDLSKQYESTDLFPLFANRILSSSRPEYKAFLDWLDANNEPPDPFELLARTGGTRATDSILIYPKPEPTPNNRYDLKFFCHGLSHMPKEAVSRIEDLKVGDVLFPLYDELNPFDSEAIGIRTNDPPTMIGYVPRFFAHDLRTCIRSNRKDNVSFQVLRMNTDAPLQYRLLCHFNAPWPDNFNPCTSDDFKLQANELSVN